MRAFERSIRRVGPLLTARLGEEGARILIQDSLREYADLTPRIPFLGSNNPLILFFTPTPRYLAVYRALEKQGYTTEDARHLIFEIGSESLRSIPSILRRVIGILWFSSWLKHRLRKRAAISKLREYPGNFVLDYVEGDGIEFDYGVDYLECASCKFLASEGASELGPYICAVDLTASDILGWGLTRTTTLAEGSSKCDFRFKKGGKTNIELPSSLQLYLASMN